MSRGPDDAKYGSINYPVDIKISPEGVFRAVLMGVTAVCIAGVVAVTIQHYWMSTPSEGFTGQNVFRFFNLDDERNLPTFFTVFIFVCCSLVLYAISVQKYKEEDRWAARWLILSLTFIFLSLDEFAGIHELVGLKIADRFEFGGLLNFAWVLPGMLFVTLFGFYYIMFLLSLPRHISFLMLAAGSLYVGGAIGIEMVAGRHYETHGADNMIYLMLSVAEEALEMLGLAVFLYSLLRYLSCGWPHVRVMVASSR